MSVYIYMYIYIGVEHFVDIKNKICTKINLNIKKKKIE